MGVVRLLAIRDAPLSVAEVLQAVADPAAGGTAVFVGTVRGEDGRRPVTELEYLAHPTAERVLAEVADRVADRQPVVGLAAVHRTGRLAVGELAVVVAASSAHRAAAFTAARALIDELKQQVPIWKRQLFADGTQEWVNCVDKSAHRSTPLPAGSGADR